MPNMTIKRWDTSANNNAGGWVEQYPKTVTTQLYDSNGDAVFETIGNEDKIKVEYLPNSVFDSLKFYSSFDASVSSDKEAKFVDVLKGIYDNAATNDRSSIGYYIVFSDGGALPAASSTTSGYIASTFKAQYTYKHDDSSSSSATSVTVEAGDWVIIESASGAGTTASPFVVTLSVVSNTYELYQGATGSSAGSPGLVPGAASGDRLKFLRGDGTYQTPTNTFRAISVDTDGDGTVNETLLTTEDLVIKKGANVDVSESLGVVTIGISNETIEDVVGGMVSSNTTSGITVSYADNTNGAGKLNFSVPVMTGADLQNTTDGTAGLAPAPSAANEFNFLRGDATYATPARRVVEINGTSEISSSGGQALDLKSALGVVVSAGTNTGEAEFKMEYPIAVSSSTPSSYEVANGIWFHI